MPLFGFDAQTDKLADVEVEGGFLGRVRRSPGVGLLIRYTTEGEELEFGGEVCGSWVDKLSTDRG